jgi:hypothetical protein
VWDSVKNPAWRLNRYPFLKKMHEANGVIVYTVS